jgi:GT2 family glycosyltransferase
VNPTVPQVSVVMATHDRPRRLAMALAALAAQTLPRERFEVIVVDDGSGPETGELLREHVAEGSLDLRVIRREQPSGPGGARNGGWPEARAPIVAFIDDDCVADPDWLAAGLRACGENPGAVVQGRVDPNPSEMWQYGPFSHTVGVYGPTPWFETCNIFYPRELIERLGGFDEDTFRGHGGEDTDLGWRAIAAGAATDFSPEARAFHAVERIGPVRMLRFAAHWHRTMLVFARHPEIRDHLPHRIFWKWTHYALLRWLVARVLPRRYGVVKQFLGRPYTLYLLTDRSRRAGPLLAPYVLALDLLELIAVVRGAVRYRTPVV